MTTIIVNPPPPYRSPEGPRLRLGLPVSTTRFADTGVSTGSTVSPGVDSERSTPDLFFIPRDRIFHAAFASLSASHPQVGHECSRTHSGLTVETPHVAYSSLVPLGLTATKCVPSRSQLYSSTWRTVPHAAPARSLRKGPERLNSRNPGRPGVDRRGGPQLRRGGGGCRLLSSAADRTISALSLRRSILRLTTAPN